MVSRIFIGIAVSKPDELSRLPGAIPSALRLAAWARSQCYDTTLVTDSDPGKPVTAATLRDVLAEKLGDGGQERVIVAFVGHGLIRGGAEEYWLLNNWRTEATEAVNYIKMRDRLATYGIGQLAIISDACRSLPNSAARFVEGNGIVPIKDYDQKPVQTADWYGTQAAQPSYASPLSENEAYCFFTRVLTDALLGIPATVTENDPARGKVVRNDKLMTAIEEELPRLASQYDRRQVPDLRGSWRSTPDNIWSVLQQCQVDVPPAVAVPRQAIRQFGLSPDRARAERTERATAAFAARLMSEEPQPGTGLRLANGRIEDVVICPRFGRVTQTPWGLSITLSVRAASFALRLENGRWAAGAVYNDLMGLLAQDEHGIESFILSSAYTRAESASAARAVAKTATGQLLGQPYDVAAKLREMKHMDPVYGALASYLYARGSEIDEIRRLLYFYGKNGQPAPFDAVLLARIPITRSESGWSAHVPAVRERPPRSPTEAARGYTFEATPAIDVSVAGGFPWLRQGWALLEDDFRPDFRKLYRFARHLAPSTFTTFVPEIGDEFQRLIVQGEI